MRCSVAGLTTEHRIPGRLESFTKPPNISLKAKFLCFKYIDAGYRHWNTSLWTNSPPSLYRNLHICYAREVVSCFLYKFNLWTCSNKSYNYLTALSGTLALIRAAAVKIRRAFIAKLQRSTVVTRFSACRCGQDLWVLRHSITRKECERLIMLFYITVFISRWIIIGLIRYSVANAVYSYSSVSYDRPIASSQASSPQSAI
jgi:hypothetical protein